MTAMRLSDLAAVLEALIPDEDADRERMLLVLSRLRCTGRVVVLDTSHDAFARLAEELGVSPCELEHTLRHAPADDRDRIRRAVVRPKHQGCVHLRAQLGRRPHAGVLLEAWLSARWYGWPGLRIEVVTPARDRCCCGRALQQTPTHHPMSAIDI